MYIKNRQKRQQIAKYKKFCVLSFQVKKVRTEKNELEKRKLKESSGKTTYFICHSIKH